MTEPEQLNDGAFDQRPVMPIQRKIDAIAVALAVLRKNLARLCSNRRFPLHSSLVSVIITSLFPGFSNLADVAAAAQYFYRTPVRKKWCAVADYDWQSRVYPDRDVCARIQSTAETYGATYSQVCRWLN